MKSILKMLVVGFLTATIATSWAAPGVSESDSSAGPEVKGQKKVIRSAPAQVVVSVTPILLPLRDNASWNELALEAVAGDYTSQTSLVWSNLWQNNPDVVLWYRIEFRSANGGDTISITDPRVSTQSNDGGHLNVTNDVFGSYSTTAPGWKANGQKVESGSEDVSRFVVLYRPKMFDDTESAVRSWVNSFSKYAHTLIVNMGGGQFVRVLSRSVDLANLEIEVVSSGGNFQVRPVGLAGNSYTIFGSPTVVGNYVPVASGTNNQSVILPMGAGNYFFKVGL